MASNREHYYTRLWNIHGTLGDVWGLEDPESGAVTDASAPTYYATLEATAPGVGDAVIANQQPGESWTDTLQRILPSLATSIPAAVQQYQLLQVQMDRAKRGLPPLNTTQYAAGVQVGLSTDTQKMLLWGGLAVAGVLILPRLLGRR